MTLKLSKKSFLLWINISHTITNMLLPCCTSRNVRKESDPSTPSMGSISEMRFSRGANKTGLLLNRSYGFCCHQWWIHCFTCKQRGQFMEYLVAKKYLWRELSGWWTLLLSLLLLSMFLELVFNLPRSQQLTSRLTLISRMSTSLGFAY